jgi:hypothetical protein
MRNLYAFQSFLTYPIHHTDDYKPSLYIKRVFFDGNDHGDGNSNGMVMVTNEEVVQRFHEVRVLPSCSWMCAPSISTFRPNLL